MRFAMGGFASAALLFASAATGLVGSWGLPVGAVALVVAAVIGAGLMEASDPYGVERLARRSRTAPAARETTLRPVEPT